MNVIKVMVNGLPGKMATNVVEHVITDDRFELISYSLTGPETTEAETKVGWATITLIRPDQREEAITEILKKEKQFIAVDFTLPAVANSNAEFYWNHNIPFVMGTTGGDKKVMEEMIFGSRISAVIAPNMAKQVVVLQSAMEYMSLCFPDLFKEYSLEIKESHQKGKADTSGTVKAMIEYFVKLGFLFLKIKF